MPCEATARRPVGEADIEIIAPNGAHWSRHGRRRPPAKRGRNTATAQGAGTGRQRSQPRPDPVARRPGASRAGGSTGGTKALLSPPLPPLGITRLLKPKAAGPRPPATGKKRGKRGGGGKGGEKGAACVMAVGLNNPARGPGMDAGATCNNLRR